MEENYDHKLDLMQRAIAIVTAWGEDETPNVDLIGKLARDYIAEDGNDATHLIEGMVSLAGILAVEVSKATGFSFNEVLQRLSTTYEEGRGH